MTQEVLFDKKDLLYHRQSSPFSSLLVFQICRALMPAVVGQHVGEVNARWMTSLDIKTWQPPGTALELCFRS